MTQKPDFEKMLSSLVMLEKNWDGHGAEPISLFVATNAMHIHAMMTREGYVFHALVPWTSGGISMLFSNKYNSDAEEIFIEVQIRKEP